MCIFAARFRPPFVPAQNTLIRVDTRKENSLHLFVIQILSISVFDFLEFGKLADY